MKNKFNKYLSYYLSILFVFSLIYLVKKHNVGNDSTISEWIINYSGGFTKRGIIGHIAIFFANFFDLNLRDSILIFQIIIITIYYFLIYYFLRNIKTNKVILLSIFTPIFILYPVAEIEVLARKEIFIFCIFIIFLLMESSLIKDIYKMISLSLAVLIWEPVVFYFIFFLAVDLLEKKTKSIDLKSFLNLIFYVPAITIAIYIIFNPITPENHSVMENYLKNNFQETCYMSCGLLKTKSSIYDQFAGNFDRYSFPIFLRYSLIILFGFGPLIILAKNSKLIDNRIIFFRNFNNILIPISIMLIPVILLFAMGYDWGRWVNISYVFSILFYFFLYKKNKINLKISFFEKKDFIIFRNKKIFVVFFFIFCFGWNPKTVITGDVGGNPWYQIPRKALKIVYYDFLKP